MKTFAVSFLCSPSKIRKKTGESPIEVSISVNGERVYYQLPKTCNPDVFRKIMDSGRANDVKTYCDGIRAKIGQYQTLLEVQGKPVTAKKIKAFLEGKEVKSYTLLELTGDYLKTKLSTPSAYAKYRNTFNRLKDYLGRDKEISEITSQDIVNYYNKYNPKFAQGTMRNEMKKIKSLFLFAFNDGRIERNPFSGLHFSFKDPDKPFLTYEEIQAIRDAKLDERLDNVRNFFLFLCFSGLEYADVVNLKKEEVKENRYGQLYIKKQRVKTKVEYISILYEDADELWRLFDGDIPVISNAKTNAYLKEIATAAGIDKSVTTLTARHTYATYLLSKRLIPVDVVQKMLGHTTNRQSLHYAKMLEDAVFDVNYRHSRNITQPTVQTKADEEDMEAFRKMLGI